MQRLMATTSFQTEIEANGGIKANYGAYTFREGMYVRVVGHLRSFANKRSVVAFRIQPITDSNEITYHYLETLYVHLGNTRGVVRSVPRVVLRWHRNPTITLAIHQWYRCNTLPPPMPHLICIEQ
jgi:hypothetical protein